MFLICLGDLEGEDCGGQSVTAAPSENSTEAFIGKAPFTDGNFAQGYIDDLYIWDRELTKAEVYDVYTAGNYWGQAVLFSRYTVN